MKTPVTRILTAGILLCIPLWAQGPPLAPAQLDPLVEPVALYPDPLLVQVLTASTYWDQIPQAAQWADAHSYLNGPALADAIQEDQLPWDPSVLALLPFPSALDQMARDPGWTQALGNAVLDDRPGVMDAVQRMRREAMDYGYLRDNQYYRVTNGPYIEILPVTPGYYYVPMYNPAVIFTRPRRPIGPSAVIRFGSGVQVGAYFAPFGWRQPAFAWGQHNIIVNNHPWVHAGPNREHLEHGYAPPVRRVEPSGHAVAGRGGPAYVEHHERARQNEHGKAENHGHGHDHDRNHQ